MVENHLDIVPGVLAHIVNNYVLPMGTEDKDLLRKYVERYVRSYGFLSASDSYGHTTTVFGTGTLNGNVLTFTCTTSGQLAYQGVMYPYYSNAQMTCIRQ